MKKQIFLPLLALIGVLAACGGNEPAVEAPTPQATAVTESAVSEPEAEATLPPPSIDTAQQEAVPATPEPTAEPSGPITPWPVEDFGYGIQIHGNATYGDPATTMDLIQNRLGLDWIKVQIQWWLVDPDPDADQWFFYDGVIDEAYRHNLRVMVSVVGAPEWTRAAGGENGPPDDYSTYAAFLEEMLTRYDGQIHAVEVWNEQNLDREWTTANGISPEDYVRFLQVAYETIKAHDSNIIVISGALSPTGTGDWVRWADDFEYMDRALAAGMLNYTDCVGAHHNGYNIGPDVPFDAAGSTAEAATANFRGPFDNPHHSWSLKTTLDTYAEKVQAIDPSKKLCVTEFGWATSEGYDEYPPGFEFARDNTLQEQGDFIIQAYQQMQSSGDVWLTFLFNFDFGNKGNGPTDDTVPYSILDINGAPRPAFDMVAAMEKPR